MIDRISFILAAFVTTANAVVLTKNLQDKPFKINELSDFYSALGYWGPALALAVSLSVSFSLRNKLQGKMLPLVPVVLFPLIFWASYLFALVLFGRQIGDDRGDLRPLTAHIELASLLLNSLLLSFVFVLAIVGVAAVAKKRYVENKGAA